MDQDLRNAARAAAVNVPARARRRPRRHGLLGWSVLPEYLRDNEFIKGYYRRVDMTAWETIKTSLGYHNETMNIWTHAVGFLLFVGLTIFLARAPPTPLAFGAHQVDAVWSSVRTHLQQLQHGLHLLQHSAEALGHNLQHGAEALTHNLQHSAEALTDSLHHSAEALSGSLQHGAEALTHNLRSMHVREALAALLHYPVSRWPFYVFLAGAMTCLLLSSVCHLCGCCSKHVSQFMWRVDYSGIAILIVTSFYPEIWYAFLCEPWWRNFYLITTSVMGLATVAVSLLEVFQSTRYRHVRACIFLGLGLWGIVPVIHQWFAYPDVWAMRDALKLELIMGVCYVSGAGFFALRIPERWLPGKFDVFFASHQIFHVCVVVGALVHFRAIRVLLQWRDASGGCAAPILSGPVEHVLRDRGPDLVGLDQVLEQIRQYAYDHFGVVES